MRRCAAALLRNSSTELRYSRLCPCVYARLRFGALIRRCTQSLISVASKSFRSRTPRFNKTLRTVADFPSADRLLGCPRKIISVVYVHVEHKTKSSHKRVSLLFWKPASTRRDLRFSSPTPQPRRRLALRAVTPFRYGKMQAVQALRVFNKTIRAFSHFPSRVCFFTHLSQKKKLTQSCEFFLLETGVDILSRARVRVIHRALLRCAAKCAARGSPITRCIPFASGKSFRSRTPRFNKTIRTVADFPSADRLLGCPRQYIFIGYKTKSSHKRVSFLFWKPASTYSPGPCPAKYPLRG